MRNLIDDDLTASFLQMTRRDNRVPYPPAHPVMMVRQAGTSLPDGTVFRDLTLVPAREVEREITRAFNDHKNVTFLDAVDVTAPLPPPSGVHKPASEAEARFLYRHNYAHLAPGC